jgi:hypothetical protein
VFVGGALRDEHATALVFDDGANHRNWGGQTHAPLEAEARAQLNDDCVFGARCASAELLGQTPDFPPLTQRATS